MNWMPVHEGFPLQLMMKVVSHLLRLSVIIFLCSTTFLSTLRKKIRWYKIFMICSHFKVSICLDTFWKWSSLYYVFRIFLKEIFSDVKIQHLKVVGNVLCLSEDWLLYRFVWQVVCMSIKYYMIRFFYLFFMFASDVLTLNLTYCRSNYEI